MLIHKYSTQIKWIWILAITVIIICCGTALAENTFVNDNGEYFVYNVDQEGATLLKYGVLDLDDTPQTVIIPPLLEGYPLCCIGANAFNCRIIQEGRAAFNADVAERLVLPEGLVTLETDALNGAYGFQEIAWPASLVDAQNEFLFDVTAVIRVSDSNPRYTSSDGFLIDKQENTLLYAAPESSDYSLPEVEAFSELSLKYYQPEQIVFPDSARHIASYTCYDNTNTLTVIIPGSIKTIEDNAFYAMGVEEFILGDGIKHIGAHAFYDTEIEQLYLPESVEWLGFDFCQEEVELTGQPALGCYWETEDEYEERMEQETE